MSNKIFTLIEGGANAIRKLQTEVSETIKAGEFKPFCEAAEAVAAKYAKDKKSRNNRLSMLRVQMARACDTLEIARLTVVKDDGTWTVKVVEPKEPDEDAAALRAFAKVEAAARSGGPVLAKLLTLVRELAEAKPSTDAANEIPESLRNAA